MSRLLLVKHSLPEIDPEQEPARWRLSAAGRLRCVALAEVLSLYLPFRLVSSCENKAKETAALVAEALGIEIQMQPGLHEHERSQAGFLKQIEFQEKVAALFSHPDKLVFGTETAAQAGQRFTNAVDSLLSQEQPIHGVRPGLCIVAHGTVISLFLALRCQANGYALWQQLGLPALVVLETNGWQIQAIRAQIGSEITSS